MNTKEQDEFDRLRAEIAALRERSSASELALRLSDRDQEYRQRLKTLESAAARLAAQAGPGDAQLAQLLAVAGAGVTQIHHQGYVIFPGLLNPAQLERVRTGMAPLFQATRCMFSALGPQPNRQTIHIQNLLTKTRAADEVALHPLLRAVVGGVLGHDFLLNAGAVAMSPDPGCSAQELHRDDGSYALVPRPRLPLVVTAAIALDDFTKENGGTRIVPSSCSWPPSRRPTADEVIPVEMPAGSVLLYDGAIFHGGGANVTPDQTRRTLALNYTRGWLRTQFNQYLSVPRELLLSLPTALQNDLGYQLSTRGLGGCDNQAPLAYLQRMVAMGGDGAQSQLGREVNEAQAIDVCTLSRTSERTHHGSTP